MTFNSFRFFLFFPIVVLLYYTVPKKNQWMLLLASSCFFYLFANYKFAFFLIGTTLTTFFAAKHLAAIMEQQQAGLAGTLNAEQKKALKAKSKARKKRTVALTLLLNFGILAYLKYANFFVKIFGGIFGNGDPPHLSLLLPLGISFYTFQAVGYLIDVYRGKYPPEKNPAKFALFLSFFPQIMEGPIGRYNDLAHQLYEPHVFDYDNAKFGLQLMLWGYFKKVVIADRAGILVNMVYGDYRSYSGIQLVITGVVYAVQIYADFSGYIDIATGAAQVLGIRLAPNFLRPYFSKSVAEFWRRWHISLGTWFRDYLFYSFSLSKASQKLGKFCRTHLGAGFGKNVPAVAGLAVVWITTGLWHGADWHYVLYGVYYGVLIIAAMLCKPLLEWLTSFFRVPTASFGWKLFQTARTFLIVCVGFVLFRAENLPLAFGMLKSIATFYRPAVHSALYAGDFSRSDMAFLVASTGVLLAVSLLQRKWHLRETLAQKKPLLRWSVYVAAVMSVIFLGVLYSNDPAQFIYFQF